MRIWRVLAFGAALAFGGAAQAQEGGAPAPAAPPPAPPADMMRGPDERIDNLNRFRNEVEAGAVRSMTPVPVHPDDVTVGKEVRDSKGVVIGSVSKVGLNHAVITSPGGKIEIEFASLAKNRKGLLINMRKAKFDEIVAGANKPAKPN
jgi:hypothetical protein